MGKQPNYAVRYCLPASACLEAHRLLQRYPVTVTLTAVHMVPAPEHYRGLTMQALAEAVEKELNSLDRYHKAKVEAGEDGAVSIRRAKP